MKFFIYARKSTDDEERQILSIQAQLDELRLDFGRNVLPAARRFPVAPPIFASSRRTLAVYRVLTMYQVVQNK